MNRLNPACLKFYLCHLGGQSSGCVDKTELVERLEITTRGLAVAELKQFLSSFGEAVDYIEKGEYVGALLSYIARGWPLPMISTPPHINFTFPKRQAAHGSSSSSKRARVFRNDLERVEFNVLRLPTLVFREDKRKLAVDDVRRRLEAMGKAVPSEEESCYDMLQAEDTTRCVYCQEDFEDEASLKMGQCGHVLHRECLMQLSERNYKETKALCPPCPLVSRWV